MVCSFYHPYTLGAFMKKVISLILLLCSIYFILPNSLHAQEAQAEEPAMPLAKAMWFDKKFDKWFLATVGFTASPGAMNQNGPYGILFGTDIWRFLAWEIALDFSFRSLSFNDPLSGEQSGTSTLLPISIKPSLLIQPKISLSKIGLHIYPYIGVGAAMTIKVNIGGDAGVKMEEVGNFVGGVPIKLGCRFQWKKLFVGINLEYTWIYNNADASQGTASQFNDISGFSVAAQIGAAF